MKRAVDDIAAWLVAVRGFEVATRTRLGVLVWHLVAGDRPAPASPRRPVKAVTANAIVLALIALLCVVEANSLVLLDERCFCQLRIGFYELVFLDVVVELWSRRHAVRKHRRNTTHPS